DLQSDCGINITVSTRYLEKQSDLLKNAYAFSYSITIRNERPDTVQLLRRHWIITDQDNHVEEVKGMGVVGQQPHIKPGESLQYSSGTIIGSKIGDMKGYYTMQSENGEIF